MNWGHSFIWQWHLGVLKKCNILKTGFKVQVFVMLHKHNMCIEILRILHVLHVIRFYAHVHRQSGMAGINYSGFSHFQEPV